jgi:phosphatidylglycerol:prolipoprotein diacylglycerol transferase
MLAISVGFWLVMREAIRKGLSEDLISDLSGWLILGGLIGARMLHVADHWNDIFSKDFTKIFKIWEGGLAIWGAILGGLITLSVFAWCKKLNLTRLLDTFSPGVVMGQAIGRIACIITGDSVGKPTTGPFGLAYTNPEAMVPQLGVYYTPTPIYEILLNTGIFIILWRTRKLRLPDGTLFLIYLSLYSLGRFFITFMSAYREFAFGLNQAQFISAISLIITLAVLLRMVLINNSKGA